MVDLENEYPGQAEAGDANYPTGGFKNETTPGVFDGTPFEKAWANDLNAFMQGLIKAAGITVGGSADTVLVSQLLQALVHQIATADMLVDSGAADAYVLAPLTDNYAIDSYEDGMQFRYIPDSTNTTASTVDISAIGAKAVVNAQGNALTGGELQAGATITLEYRSGSDDFSIVHSTLNSGTTVQEVGNMDGAVATGTTVIPFDDTIPQNTEGDEYLTQAITPRDAANILEIEIHAMLSNSNNALDQIMGALFKDSVADALAATTVVMDSADEVEMLVLKYRMAAGTLSPITFKFRAGAELAGTTTFNGLAGARLFGGVAASSITVREMLS